MVPVEENDLKPKNFWCYISLQVRSSSSCCYPTGGRFPKRVYSELYGVLTEFTPGAGRRTEISRKIETSV